MVAAVLLAICLTVGAVSADDGWSFNFSSSNSSNSNGGSMSLENGKLVLQDIEFNIPDGYEENESARTLGNDTTDVEDAKYSLCNFLKSDDELVIKVFYFDDGEFDNLTPMDSEVAKTMGGIEGVYDPDKYDDNTPTFRYLKDGKFVEINAPDDDTILSILGE